MFHKSWKYLFNHSIHRNTDRWLEDGFSRVCIVSPLYLKLPWFFFFFFFSHSFSMLQALREQDLHGHDRTCLISNSLLWATVKFQDEFLSVQMIHTSPEIIVTPFYPLMSETIKTSVGTNGHNLSMKTS